MSGQEVRDDDPDLILEGAEVVQLSDNGAAGLTRLGLAEVDDKVALVNFIGSELIIGLLAGIDEES